MTTYKHDPVYDDVIFLQQHGVWPQSVVPPWAKERAAELNCSPISNSILLMAADFEIQKLRNHNCCDHDRPNGLVSRAAFNQVTEERDRALEIVDEAISFHDLKNRLHVSSELGIRGAGSPLSWQEIDKQIDALQSDIAEAQQAWNKICSIFGFDPREETWDSLPEKLMEKERSASND